MSINPNTGIPSPDDQNKQILQQYASARQNLKNQQNQALDLSQQQVNRQQAISGMQGGTALKENENAARAVNTDYGAQQAQLDTSQAGALSNVAATQEAQQYQQKQFEQSQGQQLGEFTASQAQQAGQFTASQAQQAQQFGQNYALASQQFNESKNEFAQQLQYQWSEFTQNQQTNFINAAAALKNAGIDSNNDYVYGGAVTDLQGRSGIASPSSPVPIVQPGTNNGPGRQVR